MDIRVQHILLKIQATLLLLGALTLPALAENKPSDGLNINNEIFEIGAFIGIINIEDFTSEVTPGISLTFRASEDFFIQYNYLKINKVKLSLYEDQTAAPVYFTGKSRKFSHYDLLVGYNIFQGEFFKSKGKASLSNLYLLLGAGETAFGEEARFTYVAGIGYQVALTKRLNFNVDFKNYIYKSSVILDQDKTVNSTQVSSGLQFVF